MIRSIESPCKDCPDRHVGCHSECGKYIAYDAALKDLRKAKADQAELEQFLYEASTKRPEAMRDQRRRRR